MICYKDKIFCTGDGCAKFSACPDALTDEVKDRAIKWWGDADAPISVHSEPRKLDCWEGEE